jgi:hypothetical protein
MIDGNNVQPLRQSSYRTMLLCGARMTASCRYDLSGEALSEHCALQENEISRTGDIWNKPAKNRETSMKFTSENHTRAQHQYGNIRRLAVRAEILAALMLPMVYAADLAAATLDVCASGCSYKTIQSAVNRAKAGDTLAIGAGTYFENVKLPGFRLTLQGVGRRRAVIDGNLQGPVFTIGSGQPIDSGDTITISELTIMRGFSADAGGILVLNSSPLVVQHSILLSNRSTGYGGAVRAINTHLVTIADCNLINNQAVAAGGALETEAEDLTITISDSVFSHNSADFSGGAIGFYTHVSSLNITNTTFTQNQARFGGAIDVYNLYSGGVRLTDVVLSGNSATESAGAMSFSGAATLTRTTVTHNVAGTNGGGIVDADRFKGPSTLSLVDSEVVHNSAGAQGGGIFLSGGLTQTDSTIAHNSPNDCVNQRSGAPCT